MTVASLSGQSPLLTLNPLRLRSLYPVLTMNIKFFHFPCSLILILLLAFHLRADEIREPKPNVSAVMPAHSSVSTTNDYELCVASEKDLYALKEDISLEIFLRNVGKDVVTLPYTRNPTSNYTLAVFTDDNKLVPFTSMGKSMLSAASIVSRSEMDLSPGREIEDVFSLTQLFDLSHPGIYYVTVKRRVRTRDNKSTFVLQSDPLQFSIE